MGLVGIRRVAVFEASLVEVESEQGIKDAQARCAKPAGGRSDVVTVALSAIGADTERPGYPLNGSGCLTIGVHLSLHRLSAPMPATAGAAGEEKGPGLKVPSPSGGG